MSWASPQSGWVRSHADAIEWMSFAVTLVGVYLVARTIPSEAIPEVGARVSELGAWGPVAFGLIFAVATVLLFPGSLLTIATGAIFGLVTGMITASVASTAGAASAFLIARYVARDKVQRHVEHHPRLRAVDRAIREGDWKIVMLLRLSPMVPFNFQNYLYGVTDLRFGRTVLASWISMLPGTFFYVYLGDLGRTAMEPGLTNVSTGGTWFWVLRILGLVAALGAVAYATRLAKKHLGRLEQFSQQQKPSSESPGRRSLLRPTVAIFAAAIAVTGAVIAHVCSERIEGWVSPPSASLRETYESRPYGPSFDHHVWDELVRAHVREGGWVDYEGFASDRSALSTYVDAVAAAPYEALGRDEKLALLLNAYNAFHIVLILEHGPITSIRQIPSDQRWDAQRWELDNRQWSLNEIEHQEIREHFREPRIHFALVCAAIGCPPLRREAYVAERLDAQLEDQARYFHRHPRWFQFDAQRGVVRLTRIYLWYREDFQKVRGSILAYAAEFVPELRAELRTERDLEIEFLSYDWRLNSLENAAVHRDATALGKEYR